jgi:protein involved in polysaccharide export with SLBB domain
LTSNSVERNICSAKEKESRRSRHRAARAGRRRDRIIATGTPSGVALGMNPPRYLQPGDKVSIEITAIGELVNPVSPGTP